MYAHRNTLVGYRSEAGCPLAPRSAPPLLSFGLGDDAGDGPPGPGATCRSRWLMSGGKAAAPLAAAAAALGEAAPIPEYEGRGEWAGEGLRERRAARVVAAVLRAVSRASRRFSRA